MLISGEPGIGKSRLTAALAERLHTEPHLRYAIFARPITRTAPSIRLSTSSAGHRRSGATTRPRPDWKSSRALLARAAPTGRGCGTPRRSAVAASFERHPLPNLSHNARRKGH